MAASLLSCIVLLFALASIPSIVTGLGPEKFVVQPHLVRFNEEPHDWTVTEGTSVNLTCNTTVVEVNGYMTEDITPLPQITWFHNDVMINFTDHFTISNYGINTSVLTIKNVTSLEQGEYYCVVNEWVKPDGDWWAKTRSKSGHVKVMDKDSLVVVDTKEYIKLSCKESNSEVPSSSVVWKKDGVEMTATDCDGDLLLINIGEENSGYYQCVNTIDGTTLLSYNVSVNVKSNLAEGTQLLITNSNDVETHFIKIKSDADLTGCRGSPINQTVVLKCRADNYREIRWYKNGELLDLSSEDISYNQTSGELVIRREDACELLGIYQCFASNDIDTVHVSTRVLPLGWPNHPGRPELVSYITLTIGFILKVKLHHPDYLGGLNMNKIVYDVYMMDSGTSGGPRYINTFNSSLDTVDINLGSKIRAVGIDSIRSIYYLTVQLVTMDKDLLELEGLPTGSPLLYIDAICDLVDYPPPMVEQTCVYDERNSLMVTRNISWSVKGSTLNYVFADHLNFWQFSGNCYYPNGTMSMQPISHWMLDFRNYMLLEVPKDSYCNVSVSYDIPCSSGYVSASATLQLCNNSGPHDQNDIININNETNTDPTATTTSNSMNNNTHLIIELFTLLGVVSLLQIIMIVILILLCCVHFKKRKQGRKFAYAIVK